MASYCNTLVGPAYAGNYIQSQNCTQTLHVKCVAPLTQHTETHCMLNITLTYHSLQFPSFLHIILFQ